MNFGKNALLIYSAEDVGRNKWFIERLTEEAAAFGVGLKLLISDEFDFESVDQTISENAPLSFVINRSRNSEISQWFENAKLPSYNNSRTISIGNDKLAEYDLFRNLGLPVMRTVQAHTLPGDIPFDFPLVIKSRTGHGGKEVFRADSLSELEKIMAGTDPDDYIFQEMCDEPGKDMRVYVLGGKIVASVLRTSDTDFRSNFSLGGNAELTDADDEIEEYVHTLVRELDADYIGVDFIKNGGSWVLNEMEDAAGARMLYKLTDLDIAHMYMCYICEKSFQNLKNAIK